MVTEKQEGKEIAIRGDREVALYDLETRFAMAIRQRELLEKYIKERLHPDKHFYTVGDEPSRKPSLTKEGAELICLPHALKGRYEWVSGLENPPLDDAPYQITIKCILERDGRFEGEGIGSASSMITKKDGGRIQRQKDPGLRHNATIKMACKSAYIAATLNSTAASEFFTQDLEDDQTGESKQGKTNEYWCPVHKTQFFMRGKMKSYAHPIKDEKGKDTGEWCHMRTSVEHKVPQEQIEKDKEELWEGPGPEEQTPGDFPLSPTASATMATKGAGDTKTPPPGVKAPVSSPGATEPGKVAHAQHPATDAQLRRIREVLNTLVWSEEDFCKRRNLPNLTGLTAQQANEILDYLNKGEKP